MKKSATGSGAKSGEKRKSNGQVSLDSFFSPTKKQAITMNSSSSSDQQIKSIPSIDLTEEEDKPQTEASQQNIMATIAATTAATATTPASLAVNKPNAFRILMKNSRLINKKLKAVFLLEFSCNSNNNSNSSLNSPGGITEKTSLKSFHPQFITQETKIQEILSLVNNATGNKTADSYWMTEVNLTNFRWFCFPSGYRDIQLYLVTNLKPAYVSNKVNQGGVTGVGGGEGEMGEKIPLIPISLMKSMIQKGIRRKLTQKVLSLTRQIAYDNPIELIRRLIIICLEDVMLHPSLPILVWLMVALTKGFIFHEVFALISMLITSDLCQAEFRDCYPPSASIEEMIKSINLSFGSILLSSSSSSTTETTSTPVKEKTEQQSQSEEEEEDLTNLPSLYELFQNNSWRTLIAALSIRASYGGMDFDRVMLEKYALLWSMRILKSQGRNGRNGEKEEMGLSQEDLRRSIEESVNIPCYLSPEYIHDMCIFLPTQKKEEFFQNHWGLEMCKNFFPSSSSSSAKVEPTFTPPTSSSTSSSSSTIGTFSSAGQILASQSLVCQNQVRGVLRDLQQQLIKLSEKPLLQNQFQLSMFYFHPDDLIIEGIDFHCDWNLISSVITQCNSELTKYFETHPKIINLDTFEDITTMVEFKYFQSQSNDKETNQSSSFNPTQDLLEKEQFENYLRQLIWIFRSSINTHKLWSFLNVTTSLPDLTSPSSSMNKSLQNAHTYFNELEGHIVYENNTLLKKGQLAGLWKIIGPAVKAYCERRLSQISSSALTRKKS